MTARILIFIFIAILPVSSFAEGDGKGPQKKQVNQRPMGMGLMRGLEQQMVEDDKFLYILRGPQLLKVSKKDLTVEKQVLLLPAQNNRQK